MGSKEYKIGLKIEPKVGLLRSKKMQKHLLNNFEVQNMIFSILKMAKNDPSKPPKEQNVDRKPQFSRSFVDL